VNAYACTCTRPRPRAPPPPRRPAWWRTLRGVVNHLVITPILTHVQWPRTTPRLAVCPLGHGRPPRYNLDINPRSVTQNRIARSRPRIHTPYFHTPHSRPGIPTAQNRKQRHLHNLASPRGGNPSQCMKDGTPYTIPPPPGGGASAGGGIPATRQGSMRLPPTARTPCTANRSATYSKSPVPVKQ
jgi:hypothetical protein